MMWEADAPFEDVLKDLEALATVLAVGTALQGADPSTVALELKNTGLVPVTWAIVLQENEVSGRNLRLKRESIEAEPPHSVVRGPCSLAPAICRGRACQATSTPLRFQGR